MRAPVHPMGMAFVLLRLAVLLVGVSGSLTAQVITWSSLANATNLTSSDTAMDGNFRFELGVFEGSFVPTSENKDQWAQNWRPAQSTYFNPEGGNQRFNELFYVTDNDAPFTPGKAAYIWGFRGSPQQAEWILFRNTSWTWPTGSGIPSPTPSFSWVAEQANQVIIGSIDLDGNPFLMKSAAVTNASPPPTPWADWQSLALNGEPMNNPDDDPDNDGAPNLLEFVMGTDPQNSGGIPATPVTIVPVSSDKFLQITIPRRIDHPAVLTVEVANHPAGNQPGGLWDSGTIYTEVISDTLESLIVRDKTAISPSAPHRFMRLKVELPAEE